MIEKVPTVSVPFERVVAAVNWVGDAVKTVRDNPFNPVKFAKPDPITIVPTDNPFGAVTVTVPPAIVTAVDVGVKGLKLPQVP